jgi:hypothetical protein
MHLTLRTCVAAAAAAASTEPVAAQTVTGASTRIEMVGGVRILEDPAGERLLAEGGLTFAVSSKADGSVSVSMPGFVRQSTSSSDGSALTSEIYSQVLTGTTLSSETISVSVESGQPAEGAPNVADGVSVILAQFN